MSTATFDDTEFRTNQTTAGRPIVPELAHTTSPLRGSIPGQKFGGLQEVNGKLCAVFYDGQTPVYLTEKQLTKMLDKNPQLSGDMSKREGGSMDIAVRNAGFYLRQARTAFQTVREGDYGPGDHIQLANGFQAMYAAPKVMPGVDLDSSRYYNQSFLNMTAGTTADAGILAARAKAREDLEKPPGLLSNLLPQRRVRAAGGSFGA